MSTNAYVMRLMMDVIGDVQEQDNIARLQETYHISRAEHIQVSLCTCAVGWLQYLCVACGVSCRLCHMSCIMSCVMFHVCLDVKTNGNHW